jgi:hypothetical protein
VNVQLVRDEVAHILGGTLVRTGVYYGTGAVSAGGRAIEAAFGRLPESLIGSGVNAVVLYGGTPDIVGSSNEGPTYYKHRLRIQLVYSVTGATIWEADAILTPFIPAVRDAIAGHFKLNGAATALELDSISEIKPSAYPERLCIEFIAVCTEKEQVLIAA